MRRAATTPGMRRLRLALLASIAVVIGVVGGLFYLGRSARPRADLAAVEESAPLAAPEGEATVLSEGFDYEQQVAGRPVFRLQGERFTTDRTGEVALEGVRLVLFREGEPYEVRSRTAVYDPETQDAELAGDVRVAGGDGWELFSQRLDLIGNGTTIRSRGGEVSFRRGETLSGTARRLSYAVDEQVLTLEGRVIVTGVSESDGRRLGFTAQQMQWQRDGSSVQAEGAVHVSIDDDLLQANRLDARLRPDGAGLETATAEGDVRGTLGTADGGQLVFTARSADVELDPATGDPRDVLLAGSESGEPARLAMRAASDEGGPVRRLVAPLVRLTLVDGRPATASATRGVVLRERAPGGVEREAEADQLTARFGADGALAEARLIERVRIVDAGWTVEGSEAELVAGGVRGEVRGRPARAVGERGELRSPVLRFDRERSRLDAGPGVRATFRPESSPIAAAPSREAALPVGVEAMEATFFDAPQRFEFRGDVRAAQGESLLFAERLEGNEAESAMTATGKVRTQWTDAASPAGAAAAVTVITAERLDYSRPTGEARYSGGVEVRQPGRQIVGEDLLVEVDAEGRARRMLVTGGVRIEDRASGRSVAGTSADYDLDAGEALVLGDPVILREESGTTLRGRRALFDERTGSARLLSEVP